MSIKEKEENKKDGTVPSNVINEEAYHQLMREKEELENSPERFYDAKTAEYRFDFLSAYVGICQKIERFGISEYEGDLIKEKAKAYKSKYGKLNKLRWDAFKGDRTINRSSILDVRKAEIISLFGRFNTTTDVHRIVTTEWNIDASYKSIEYFRNHNLELIQAEQDKYVKDWSGLKLVYKKSRLDEYSGLYEDRKVRYDATHNRDDYRLLLQTLEAIRKEIEGDRLTVDGSLEVNVQETINLHVQQEVLRNLNILQFIIARVAIRTGVDQAFLMSQLEKSYYAKFTGFAISDNNRTTDEISYPSRELYDFDRIKSENARMVAEQNEVKELPPVNQEAMQTVQNTLMAALLRRKKQIIESEKRVEANIGNKETGAAVRKKSKVKIGKVKNIRSNKKK